MDELFGFLIKKDVEYKRNQLMSQYTSVRIGGPASVVVFPATQQQLVDVVHFLHNSEIEYRVIGCMSNVLPCDNEYYGVLVSTRKVNRYSLNGAYVTAECGVLASSMIAGLARSGIGGLEGLCGIPGTIGGMVTLNAGAYNCEIGDRVKHICAYSPSDNRITRLAREECDFSYRNSIFSKNDMIVLSAEFQLTEREPDIIIAEMEKIRRRRINTQPIEFPSLGSVFKKVDGVSAAYYIDNCALKGKTFGGAMVSTKHAGFIINTGNATAADFLALAEYIKFTVYTEYGIELKEEIEFLCDSASK